MYWIHAMWNAIGSFVWIHAMKLNWAHWALLTKCAHWALLRKSSRLSNKSSTDARIWCTILRGLCRSMDGVKNFPHKMCDKIKVEFGYRNILNARFLAHFAVSIANVNETYNVHIGFMSWMRFVRRVVSSAY